MHHDRIMRRTLQVTTLFNFFAAFNLAYPATLVGQLLGLPESAPLVYRALAAGAVGLFGGAYAWLSLQPVIDRPLVVFSIVGKLAAFASVLVLCLIGDLPYRSAVMTSPDLIFALIFIWWIRQPSNS